MTLTLFVLAWLLTYLLHSSMLLGGAWLLSATGIVRSPVARDTLWKVCLVGGILTATFYSVSPYEPYIGHFSLPGVTKAEPARVAAERLVTPAVPVAGIAASHDASGAVGRRVSRATSGPALLTSAPSPIIRSASSLTWQQQLLALWILGAGILLVRLLTLRMRLARSLSGRREITDGPLTAMLDALRAGAGVRRRARLTASAELAGPVAIGASEICLPERALTELDPAQQRAVLAHELGHLVRRDPLWLGVAAACETLFFFQPLNRLARRRLQEAAEYLCDDWAVHHTGGSLTLAKCLAEVATWMEAGARAVPVAGMAENRSQLVERVHRLVNGIQPSTRGLRTALPVAALALSSMAFAAPGVSPPCDMSEAASAARAQGARLAAGAVRQGEHQTWATIRDGHVLTFREGYAPRLTGQGHLGIRRGGRMIELNDGQRLLVNGHAPSDRGVVQVCESDSLRIVDWDGRTLWQVEPVRVAADEALASAETGASRAASRSSGAARASAAERAAIAAAAAGDRVGSLGDRMSSLDDRLESLGDRIDSMEDWDGMEAADVAEIARNAADVSDAVASGVVASVLPQVARLQEMGARLGGVFAPRVAGISAAIVGQVMPAIVQGVCDGGLCDDSARPVKRHKVLIKRRQP